VIEPLDPAVLSYTQALPCEAGYYWIFLPHSKKSYVDLISIDPMGVPYSVDDEYTRSDHELNDNCWYSGPLQEPPLPGFVVGSASEINQEQHA
jgi:hypothetical protein